MDAVNPKVLTIAGFDPCAGAGILADIKTFEAHGVYAASVCTAITSQNDISFGSVQWVEQSVILSQLSKLCERYSFEYVKIGIVKDLETLQIILDFLKEDNPEVNIIWDPVIKASSGFDFHVSMDDSGLLKILKDVYLITPNSDELKFLTGNEDLTIAADAIAQNCALYFKGGHLGGDMSTDYLIEKDNFINFDTARLENAEKHGSGCVLSSAITANLSKGMELPVACSAAKNYVTEFLKSARGLLGIHKPQLSVFK
jgi:hydroxymethylpyrimidine/phosphomethylpyrimidine kinase